MAVRPETLETPERELILETRQTTPGPRSTDEQELLALRDRIGDLKLVRPPEGIGCRDCWNRGRLAVVEHVESALAKPRDPAAPAAGDQLCAALERIESAHALEPEGLHWRACWIQGRDAAVEALEG